MEATTQNPLSDEQRDWFNKACEKLDSKRLQELLFELTDIHSPTGSAGRASRFMTERMRQIGLNAQYDAMNEISGNVMGEMRGSGNGATLLLYAPIDTHLEGDESDYPWAGPEQFVD